jgi:hypothetical protein
MIGDSFCPPGAIAWPTRNPEPTIFDMAVYGYSEERIASIICAMKRRRLGYCAMAAGILMAAVVVALIQPEWIFGPHQQARLWVVLALVIFVAGPLADTVWHWRSRPVKLTESLRVTEVEVREEGIWDSGPGNSVRHLDRCEILEAQDTCWGIYCGPRTGTDGFSSLHRLRASASSRTRSKE